ncbi:hypothetical protein [Sporosarcina highlanderae]|uniref:Uncharacterized protein n=1 Tax=Sporosarcina highlanderae TaxID=3035916 RepID=A0ABT8JNI9_9BACL|nr:hypothetical protein [Sporosarcina highlanderae]MDN4606612.1 hypothetical protein [Sporosarcina highlanderae]
MDFLSEQSLLYTSKAYEDIYAYFNEAFKYPYHELFILFASIGAKHNRSEDFSGRGREFRSNYLTHDQRSIAYSIILNDPDLGRNMEGFIDKEFTNKARRRLEQYAQGGASIVVEKVFRSHWDGGKLRNNYNEYDIDLLTYISQELSAVPF